MIVVTGGAGFIGSCLIRELNDKGIDEILIVDNIASTDKWMNIRNKKYVDYINKNDFMDKLPSYSGISHIIHLGACSSTTERNFDYLWNNNFEFTKALWNYCTEKQLSFIYASSASTYGDGSQGFDDTMNIDTLLPLNGYGYTKQLFDLWVKKQVNCPPQYIGLKFFNVYGPNEYFKGSMSSMVYHGYRQIKENGEIRLFKSYHPRYKDGGQLRDFIYVKDVCKVILWQLDHPQVSGLFNVGTGQERSFYDLAKAAFSALDLNPVINYIDMPQPLKEKYQYFTKAKMEKLRHAGFDFDFCSIEEGVSDYIQNYLDKNFAIY
ncbi:ADP-glyceromanno-heptose 6-epimerase [Diplocloster modestus]|uniref:ADP-L-glycero-D-manno-heptose-6-epimerase n=1 Tax=Diplocloster modestus TaxID=2850322 RepID=A0ABS6K3U0_9FIRM|nr:ADP-glyceromanno-heptose 6-epimerase [Diplocloster modestus]MBU9725188.1 ADP-glyceromanno-heptose 6-epimerase [Diplocloster modestus]